jgi:hypothetical protein
MNPTKVIITPSPPTKSRRITQKELLKYYIYIFILIKKMQNTEKKMQKEKESKKGTLDCEKGAKKRGPERERERERDESA